VIILFRLNLNPIHNLIVVIWDCKGQVGGVPVWHKRDVLLTRPYFDRSHKFSQFSENLSKLRNFIKTGKIIK
jgi:hypothetical protein